MIPQTRLDSVTEGVADFVLDVAAKGLCHRIDAEDNLIITTPGCADHIDLARDIPESYLRVVMRNVSQKGFAGLKVVDAAGCQVAFFDPAECGRIAELP